MADGLAYLLESPDAFTGYFIVGAEQERIGVVKKLIAKHSPVFQKMLYESPIRETGDVEIPDIHPDALKLYLKFAYGALEVPSMRGEMTGWNPETCMDVVYFTEKYKVPALQEIALTQLKPTGVDNLIPALRCLTFYGKITVADDVQSIVENCTSELLQHNGFVDISEQSLVYILKQEVLSVSEVELFKAALAWTTHQVDDIEKQQLFMKKLLLHIRLLTIPLEDVYNVVEPSKILSKSELVDLTKAIINKTADISFCSNNMHNRSYSLITVSISHSASYKYWSPVSAYKVKCKGQKLIVEAIICHASHKSSTTTVSLTVFNDTQQSDYAAHFGQISYNSNEDIIISPEALGWPPIRLEPDCEYSLELDLGQALPGRRQEYRCSGHTFHYGSITCIENNFGSIYNHIKELKLRPII